MPADLIQDAPTLSLSDIYVVSNDPPSQPDSMYRSQADRERLPAFPVIALPLRRKATFDCPKDHVSKLRAAIREMTRVIVIGWRAQEDHFRRELRARPDRHLQVLIVTGSERGSELVQSRLERGARLRGRFHRHSQGFAKFLESADLEAFLGSEGFTLALD